MNDDSERHLRELRIAEASWKAVLNAALDAIVSIDVDGRITLFNHAAEEMFGYSAAEMLGENIGVLMPSPYREQHTSYLRRYYETGEARAIGRIREVHARRKNGEVFPIELSISEARSGDDGLLFVAIIRDVTDRLRAEEALRFERDFAERLIDTAQMIVLVLNPSGRIMRYNKYMEQVCGRRSEDVAGASWFSTFIPVRDRPRIRALFRRALAVPIGGNVNSIVTAGGSERRIEWYSKPLLDGEGCLVGVLCTGTDVTERLAQQVELRELQRASQERARLAEIGAITAKIVHDLGNPLAALSMQAQLILRRARRGDFQPVAPVQQPAEHILNTIRRLESLVHEFTDFARDQRLEVRPISVVPFLGSCVELWQALAAEQGVDIRLATTEALPPLRADEVMLRRVLDNLLKNAMEALDRQPGEVVVTAMIPSPGRIRIVVEDSGPGVPEGIDVFRLFETTKPEGTGIGLAVARQIVAAHGGIIEHVPRTPRGTVFRIELPVAGPTVGGPDDSPD